MSCHDPPAICWHGGPCRPHLRRQYICRFRDSLIVEDRTSAVNLAKGQRRKGDLSMPVFEDEGCGREFQGTTDQDALGVLQTTTEGHAFRSVMVASDCDDCRVSIAIYLREKIIKERYGLTLWIWPIKYIASDN